MNSRNTFKTLMLTAVLSLVASWAMAEPYKEKAWEVVRMAHDAQRLYLATAERGLVVIDKATGEQTFFNVENGKLENNGINDVVVIGDKVSTRLQANRHSSTWRTASSKTMESTTW